MTLAEASIFEFALPLVRPLVIGEQRLTARSGLLIRLANDSGQVGFGEISPLPGWSTESLTDARQEALAMTTRLQNSTIPEGIERLDGTMGQWLDNAAMLPSVRFGLESAILNLIANSAGCPPARLLADRAADSVFINGLIVDQSGVTQIVRSLKREGYRAVKMKVGRNDLNTDIARTQDAYHELGDSAGLRLDANRAWTFEQAVEFARSISDCKIEYIEEPLDDFSRLEEFVQTTGLPVALDESLCSMAPEDLSQHQHLGAIVLKPTLMGGLERCAAFARAAAQQKQKIVVSSSFESSIGIAALIQFSAAFGSFNTPDGLDTLSWFENDLVTTPIELTSGRFRTGQSWRAANLIDQSLLTEVVDG